MCLINNDNLLNASRERLTERGVCVRIVGRLSLLPQDLRALLAETMMATKDNKKARLNIAFAYTGLYYIWTGHARTKYFRFNARSAYVVFLDHPGMKIIWSFSWCKNAKLKF